MLKRMKAWGAYFGNPAAWVWVLIAAHAALFSWISWRSYNFFIYPDWDLATYNQIFRGLISAHPYISLLDVSWLGNHMELTMMLLAPIYALAPHPVTLLALQSILLAAAAFPLYLIGRRVLDSAWGFFFAVAYLLYPAVGSVNLNEFHPESLLPLIHFSLFYFYLKKDARWFCVMLLLCVLAKENMSLMMIAFGVYAATQRRGAFWVAAPIGVGLAWFFLSVFVFMPPLTQGKIGFYDIYGHLGSNVPEIAWTILTKPLKVLGYVLVPYKMMYLVRHLAPLTFLSCFDMPVLLVALPNLAQHFLSARTFELKPIFYYPAEFLAFFFIAAIGGVNFFMTRSALFIKQQRFLRFLFFIVSVSFAVNFWGSPSIQSRLALGPRRIEASEVMDRYVRQVPPGAPVIATFHFLPKLSDRTDRLYSFHRVVTGTYQLTTLAYQTPDDIAYALVDFEDVYFYASCSGTAKSSQGGALAFFDRGDWRVVEAVDDIVMLKKGGPGPRLVRPGTDNPASSVRSMVFGGGIVCRLSSGPHWEIRRGETVALTLSWTPLKKFSRFLSCCFVLTDARDKPVFVVRNHPVTYGLYLPCTWKPSVAVEEDYRFPVPHDLAPGRYNLYMGVYDFFSGNNMLLTGDTQHVGNKGDVARLGTIDIKP